MFQKYFFLYFSKSKLFFILKRDNIFYFLEVFLKKLYILAAFKRFFFVKGDTTFVDLVMTTFKEFSKSTGLYVNSAKCKVYFDNVEENTKKEIPSVTLFSESPLSLLGIWEYL